MVYFNITLYHRRYFGFVDGAMRYVGWEKLTIMDKESDFWCIYEAKEQLLRFGHDKSDIAAMWYKDSAIKDCSIGLMMFINDRDSLEMLRIAEERGHVELFVVQYDEPKERFPKIGYVDAGGDLLGETDENGGEDGQNKEGSVEDVGPNGQSEEAAIEDATPNDKGEHQNEDDIVEGIDGEDDNDDAEYVPSANDVAIEDDVHFNDSEENLDLDDSLFGAETEVGEKGVADKEKRVVNEEFIDEEKDID
ncbi:hypothetical protein PIB30_031339 [Stylosanthes scabra]|uniref:PB1-like domain-containing protein n=1 Tax=Stylosanthes scabra TaxID=79078 RepID=A0ABU6UAL6_9FABA|nr:hypothetical protein [Stylosanthes scabra]